MSGLPLAVHTGCDSLPAGLMWNLPVGFPSAVHTGLGSQDSCAEAGVAGFLGVVEDASFVLINHRLA